MVSKVRGKLTYANVVVTLALVFAMSGGAYAASRVLITSSKQISPSVLKSLKGKNGLNGAPGANGKEGAAGQPGEEGPAGEKGPIGPKGKDGVSVTSATLPKGSTTDLNPNARTYFDFIVKQLYPADLATLMRHARGRPDRLTVVAQPNSPGRGLLDVCGVQRFVRVYDAADEAVDAASRPTSGSGMTRAPSRWKPSSRIREAARSRASATPTVRASRSGSS